MGRQGRDGHGHGRRRPGRDGPRKLRPVLTGTLRVVRPGVASVETPEGSFPVARGGIREGMNGDEVQVSIVTRGRGGQRMAVVRSVLTRATATFLGTYRRVDPLGAVVPLDTRLMRDFFVLPEDGSPARLGVGEGDVVAARILSHPARGQAGVVTLERRVGAAGELDLDVEAVVASFGLATEFSAAALAEAESCVVDVPAALGETSGGGGAEGARSSASSAARPGVAPRLDLRDTCTLTVDPADARDFDDAVSARRLPDGGFSVGVHIADVTHYLRWDSSLDVEARARTCSVYLADRVLPMLPERLSNDACSLRPHEEWLCVSVQMELDACGRIVAAQAARSAIRSRARLSYDEVDGLLAGGEGASSEVALEVAKTLFVLDEVARLREALRRERGAVDFSTREAKVELAPDGTPTGVRVRERTPATSLIEEAMLMANEAVAAMLDEAGVAAAFRVHERPSPDDMTGAARVLRALGVVAAGEVDALAAGEPHALSGVLARVAGTSDELAANELLLRAQRRAVYEPRNAGHYALGAPAYCHFTSPIRRYPDVIVHRALKVVMDASSDGRARLSCPPCVSTQLPRAQLDALPQLCRSCSDQERVADAAARASQKVKMAQLYAGRVGERAVGQVVGVERFGLFVMLSETCAEGLVPTRSLGDEWFAFDEASASLVGEASGRCWQLGQRVVVEVTGATPARGQIDFRLVGAGS